MFHTIQHALAPTLPASIVPSLQSALTSEPIPDFGPTILACKKILKNQPEASAIQFIKILNRIPTLTRRQVNHMLLESKGNRVLIDDDELKVVLILWESGQWSSIHGHPKPGCVFKVLHGGVQEMRYTTEEEPKLLSSGIYRTGSMAYIDDHIGYHAVGNPHTGLAVSLHAYPKSSH